MIDTVPFPSSDETKLRNRMRLIWAILAAALTFGIATTARGASCTAEIGARRAAELAERCRDVSPGTRPPCNVANSCRLMENEIRRSCRILENDAPDWCSTYANGDDPDDDADDTED